MQNRAKLQLISLESTIIDESLRRMLAAARRTGTIPIDRPKKESALDPANKNLVLWGSERTKVKIRSVMMEGSTKALRELLRTKVPEGVYVRLTLVGGKPGKL